MSRATPVVPSVSLRELAQFNPAAPVLNQGEEVAFIPMAAVSERGTVTEPEFVTVAELKSGYSYMQPGDVLVAKITPCFENNKIAVAAFDRCHGFGSTEFHVIRPDAMTLDRRYVFHFLRQDEIRRAGEQRMTGSAGQRRVPRQFLEELTIPLPPLNEQRRIAAILDQADELRIKRSGALKQIDRMLEADFVKSFIKANDIEWPETTIDDLCKSIRTGPFGSQLLHSEFIDQGIAVLGIDNAVNNEFSWQERRYISETKYKKLSRYRVYPRDLLITIMGTCGRTAIVPDNIPLAINTKHLCCLTLDESRCLPEFLHACFLRHPGVLHQLGVRERGAVMPGLNMGLIKETKIRLPPLDLQRAFAARIAEIDKLKAQHRAHLQKLDALFASLQHRAFRGEL